LPNCPALRKRLVGLRQINAGQVRLSRDACNEHEGMMAMAARQSLRSEIDELKREIETLKAAAPGESAEPATVGSELENQIEELKSLVDSMLEDAEQTVARHPVATVAGAIALGIVIGRLTAR
jgi:uncharacterized coiled-coil DUF342 family protein